jgi:large subunit ribosomal protein L25
MTKDKHEIKAESRSVLGRKVKKLRKEGFTPATVYGKGFESKSIQFATKELEKMFTHLGESTLIEVNLDEKEKLPILFRNPQYDPVGEELLHIDCYKVNLKEKITAMVPLEFVGESLAVKNGNILVTVTDEVEIEALPSDLPESIEVDLSALEDLESIIDVKDLKIDTSKLTMMTDGEQLITKVEEPKEEEIIEEPETSPEDVEVINEKGEDEDESDTDSNKDSSDKKSPEDKKEEKKETDKSE